MYSQNLAQCLVALLMAMLSSSSCAFAWSWTGSNSIGSGLTASSNVDLITTWSVQENNAHTQWRYIYATSVLGGRPPESLFVRVSSDFDASGILAGSTPGWSAGWAYPGSGNPGLFEPVYGLSIRWRPWIELISDQSPMWGGLYAKNSGGGFVHTDDLYDDPVAFFYDPSGHGALVGRVPVPGPLPFPPPSSVPEPGSLVLLALGLLGLGVASQRRKG